MADAFQEIAACPFCAGDARYWFAKNGYRLYRCGCGLGFVHPRPDPSSVYGESYFAGAAEGFGYVDYDQDKEPMVPTFREYLRRIGRLVPSGRLLDVGAATGFFLGIARESGYDVAGVELSAFAAERACQKGIPMHTGVLESLPSGPAFDVITMLDVLEHVTDPVAALAAARDRMHTGSALVVNTPDFGSLYARVLGKRWHLIVPPEHLFYYTRPVLRSLLDRAGFEVVEMTTIGKRFTIPYICMTLYKWLGWKIFARCAEAIGRGALARFGIPLNLHDNVFIIARAR